MKVLVCGSRDFADPLRMAISIYARIKMLPDGSEVIHGGARGADHLAAAAATFLGHRVTEFPADWRTHGSRAGILRNLTMLDQNPDLVIAFWNGGSRGTRHTITEARGRGIPVEIIRPPR